MYEPNNNPERTVEPQPFLCPKCQKNCKTAHGLQEHLKWVHETYGDGTPSTTSYTPSTSAADVGGPDRPETAEEPLGADKDSVASWGPSRESLDDDEPPALEQLGAENDLLREDLAKALGELEALHEADRERLERAKRKQAGKASVPKRPFYYSCMSEKCTGIWRHWAPKGSPEWDHPERYRSRCSCGSRLAWIRAAEDFPHATTLAELAWQRAQELEESEDDWLDRVTDMGDISGDVSRVLQSILSRLTLAVEMYDEGAEALARFRLRRVLYRALLKGAGELP
jgi:hypothetical protein